MGNTLGGKKSTKVMKINGEKFKFKTPVQAGSILSDHPGYVLLDSESVKHYGIRAKPLEPQQDLKAKRLYFLVELPKYPEESKNVRRVRSGIQMSAKDRLESLMLARRSSSDISMMRPRNFEDDAKMGILKNGGSDVAAVSNGGNTAGAGGGVRVKMRLPKAEVERLMSESRNGAEAAEKLVGLYMAGGEGAEKSSGVSVAVAEPDVHWGGGNGIMTKRSMKTREKRVGFLPISNGSEIQVAVS